MSETLTRPRPQIDDPEALERVLEKLALLFEPVAIFLFGSRARREAWDDSDYDLMVVLRDDFPLKERFQALERFSDFVWVWRYPGEEGQPPPPPQPQVAEVQAWIAEVEALKAEFERWLSRRKGDEAS